MKSFTKQRVGAAALLCLTGALVQPVLAHVHWTKPNAIDPTTLGLYHIDDATITSGSVIQPASGLPSDIGLVVSPYGAAQGPLPELVSTNVAQSILAPGSLRLAAPLRAESAATLGDLDGDLTIEFWYKWEPSMTSQEFSFGLTDGVKLVINRNVADPAQDRLGVQGATPGSYISAPGFTNWPDVGEEEADLDTWRHMGVCIHSAGLEIAGGKTVYRAGSVARIYLNGHAWGFSPFEFSVAGLEAAEQSRIGLALPAGAGFSVDELTIWRYDWTQNGSVASPFANGRGSGVATVSDWELY